MRPKYTPEQFAEAFWSKVDTSAGPDKCWPWIGARDQNGYGRMKRGAQLALAHRIAYELANGLIPADRPCVCHHCDNPPCCNPRCLFAGTVADNNADKIAKGRGGKGAARGERHHRAKLTEAAIPLIRAALSRGERQTVIAKRYGVSNVAICHIATGKSWKHVSTVAPNEGATVE